MIGFLLRTPLGRSIAFGALAVALFLAWDAWDDRKAVNDALSAAEAKREKINRDLETNAIDAREAQRLCRTDPERMQWNFADGRCERVEQRGGADSAGGTGQVDRGSE